MWASYQKKTSSVKIASANRKYSEIGEAAVVELLRFWPK